MVFTCRKDTLEKLWLSGDRYKGHKFIFESKSLQTAMNTKTSDGWVGKAQVDASDRRDVELWSPVALITKVYRPLRRTYRCWLPGLVRGREHSAIISRHETPVGVRFAG